MTVRSLLNGHWIESSKDNVSNVFINLNALAIYEVYENNELSYSFSLDFNEKLSKANLRMINKSGNAFQGQYLFEWSDEKHTEFKVLALNSNLKYDVIGLFVKDINKPE
jgi:hypothetical protein